MSNMSELFAIIVIITVINSTDLCLVITYICHLAPSLEWCSFVRHLCCELDVKPLFLIGNLYNIKMKFFYS